MFVNVTLNEEVKGHAGSWVEEISIGALNAGLSGLF